MKQDRKVYDKSTLLWLGGTNVKQFIFDNILWLIWNYSNYHSPLCSFSMLCLSLMAFYTYVICIFLSFYNNICIVIVIESYYKRIVFEIESFDFCNQVIVPVTFFFVLLRFSISIYVSKLHLVKWLMFTLKKKIDYCKLVPLLRFWLCCDEGWS